MIDYLSCLHCELANKRRLVTESRVRSNIVDGFIIWDKLRKYSVWEAVNWPSLFGVSYLAGIVVDKELSADVIRIPNRQANRRLT
jgi:hypothetical protein